MEERKEKRLDLTSPGALADELSFETSLRPATLEEFVGQARAISGVLEWLTGFEPGQSLLLAGPSGTGKSLLAELLARERGLELLRINVSDRMGKEQLENFFRTSKVYSMFHKGKLLLIDEVDGIPGTDRGAVPALVRLIKDSRFPVILTAIDAYKPKLRPLRAHSTLVKFTKVPSPSIAKKLRDLAKAEGISVPDDVLKNLARWSQGDLRSAITDLQTLGQGRKEIREKDLQILGYRERATSVFDVLPGLFRSGSIKSGRKIIFESDKDADELLWWLETNAPLEFPPEKLPRVYDLLSKADLFRSRVMKQQNWRFKAYMSDLMASISLFRDGERFGYVPYRMPDRIMMMGRTKARRALLKSLCKKIGDFTHTSTKVVKRDYLPYLRIIYKKKGIFGLDLDKEEAELLVSG